MGKMAPSTKLMDDDISQPQKPEQLSLSSAVALSSHFLFAFHFLVFSLSVVVIGITFLKDFTFLGYVFNGFHHDVVMISCCSVNTVEKGSPLQLHT
jgi:hypothetical protein